MRHFVFLSLLVPLLMMPLAARSQTAPSLPRTGDWSDTLTLTGHLDAGITGNAEGPAGGVNFGRLFTDRADSPQLNQLMLVLARPIDPDARGFDFGFRTAFLYGTDGRSTHFAGEFDGATHAQYQPALVEADIQAHLPILTEGGVDLRLGQFPSLEGQEVVDASANFFYSHSYEFDFGIPREHVGMMTITHLTPLDLYLGVDGGTDSVGDGAAFQGGFGYSLGPFSVVAITHLGQGTPRDGHRERAATDLVFAWTINQGLSYVADLDYAYDAAGDASAEGIANYLTYSVDDRLSLGGRFEIWRDDQGFYVAGFPGNGALADLEAAQPPSDAVLHYGKATYFATTLGLNYKPAGPGAALAGIVLRPELRWDHADGARPFIDGSRRDQITVGADIIIPFTAF